MKTQLAKTDSGIRYRWRVASATFLCMACVTAMMDGLPASLPHGLGIVGGAGLLLGNFFGWKTELVSENTGIVQGLQEPKSYDITVCIENGFSRVVHEENRAAWRSGIRVKVIDHMTEVTPCDNALK